MEDTFWFPSDGSENMLDRRDAILARYFASHWEHNQGFVRALEVGVWKGAWTTALLMNCSNYRVDGVDPFLGAASFAKSILKDRIQSLGLRDRFQLYDSCAGLPDERTYSLAHIDGEHSEQAALKDLEFAESVLTSDGVIIVDDINNYWYPGVASAVYQFMARSNFRMFATTGTKAYLARSNIAITLYGRLLADIDELPDLRAFQALGEDSTEFPPPIRMTSWVSPFLRSETRYTSSVSPDGAGFNERHSRPLPAIQTQSGSPCLFDLIVS